MKTVKPVWTKGVVLVCGNERAPDAPKPSCAPQGSHALRDWLKERIKERGLKGTLLSSRTTCLGICSKEGVTVDLVSGRGEHKTLLVDPLSEREALWAEIESYLSSEA